jgi:hypothetical protein
MQFSSGPAEFGDSDRIAKHVVDPADRRSRPQDQRGLQQPKVMAVTRPHHHPMHAEVHGIGVAVCRTVIHGQDRHSDLPEGDQFLTTRCLPRCLPTLILCFSVRSLVSRIRSDSPLTKQGVDSSQGQSDRRFPRDYTFLCSASFWDSWHRCDATLVGGGLPA